MTFLTFLVMLLSSSPSQEVTMGVVETIVIYSMMMTTMMGNFGQPQCPTMAVEGTKEAMLMMLLKKSICHSFYFDLSSLESFQYSYFLLLFVSYDNIGNHQAGECCVWKFGQFSDIPNSNLGVHVDHNHIIYLWSIVELDQCSQG